MSAESAEQFNIHDAKTNLSRIIDRVELAMRSSRPAHPPGRPAGTRENSGGHRQIPLCPDPAAAIVAGVGRPP